MNLVEPFDIKLLVTTAQKQDSNTKVISVKLDSGPLELNFSARALHHLLKSYAEFQNELHRERFWYYTIENACNRGIL